MTNTIQIWVRTQNPDIDRFEASIRVRFDDGVENTLSGFTWTIKGYEAPLIVPIPTLRLAVLSIKIIQHHQVNEEVFPCAQ